VKCETMAERITLHPAEIISPLSPKEGIDEHCKISHLSADALKHLIRERDKEIRAKAI
jgi:hypothetical protein